MPKIVFSYRRKDSQAITGWICQQFVTRYGKDRVFLDIDNTPLGVDFRDHFTSILGDAEVLIAIVGPKWRGPRRTRAPRIADKNDRVRIEIETALARQIPVIPVLVEDARMPGEADLPESLAKFPYLNFMRVDPGKFFHTNMRMLFHEMETRRIVLPPAGADDQRGDTEQQARAPGGDTEQQTRAPGGDRDAGRHLADVPQRPIVVPPEPRPAVDTPAPPLLSKQTDASAPPQPAAAERRQHATAAATRPPPAADRTEIIIATAVPHSFDHEDRSAQLSLIQTADDTAIGAGEDTHAQSSALSDKTLDDNAKSGTNSEHGSAWRGDRLRAWFSLAYEPAARVFKMSSGRVGEFLARTNGIVRTRVIATGAAAVLLAVATCVGVEMANDAVWASGVRARIIQADTSTSTMKDDLQSLKRYIDRDLSSYLSASLRHVMLRNFVWPLDEAKAVYDRTLAAFDRRLFEAIAGLARADPRTFLNVSNREILGDAINNYLQLIPGDLARRRVADIRRRLVELEQEIELTSVTFRPAQAGAKGLTNAKVYQFVLTVGEQPVAEKYQLNWTTAPRQTQPYEILPGPGSWKKSFSASLLEPFRLCYSEQQSDSRRPSECAVSNVPLAGAVRDETLTIGPAGPVSADVRIKWTPVAPNIPQF